MLFLAGLVLSATDVDSGVRVAGAALLGDALRLARFDIARQTVRRPGLPRFVALALLPGYVWLGVGVATIASAALARRTRVAAPILNGGG